MAVIFVVFSMIFISILEYGMYYYLVQISNNAVIYALVHAGDGATSTQFSNVVATKMNGTQNMLSGYTIFIQNVNTSTGVAIANSNCNDAQLSGIILVNISGTHTRSAPFFLFLPSSFTFQAATIMNSEGS
jgi:hypothetical protein